MSLNTTTTSRLIMSGTTTTNSTSNLKLAARIVQCQGCRSEAPHWVVSDTRTLPHTSWCPTCRTDTVWDAPVPYDPAADWED